MSSLEPLLTPVPGENPAGANLRYDPVYDQIKEARREDDPDLPLGDWQTTLKTADWPLVVRLTRDLLSRRTKDLQLAVWYAEARLRRDGFPGLREGLDLLRGLLEGYWDSLYPELEDGDAEMRAAPLEWVGQYLGAAVRQVPLNLAGHHLLDYRESRAVGYEDDVRDERERRDARARRIEEGKLAPEAFDAEFAATPKAWVRELSGDLDGCLEALEALDRAAEERFGDDAPSFLTLRQALQDVKHVARQLLEQKLKADPDPLVEEDPAAPETDAVPSAGEAAASPAGRPVPAVAISPMPGTGDEAAARIAAAARFLRTGSPAAPAPYLMLRGYRWGELRAGGGEIDPRLLEAPPTELRVRLKGLLLDGQWPQLLQGAEEVLATPCGRGWLDLQRYSIRACDALGSEYDALGSALRSALRALLRELPRLPAATLMDDSPAANAETLEWLREEGLVADADAPAEPRPASRRGPLESARDRVRAGDPEGAIALLLREAEQERSPRERFFLRVEAARIMVDAGFEATARPLLDDMVELVENHGLERWEDGATIAGFLRLVARCIRKQEGEYGDTASLLLRVTRLDPLQAIALSRELADGGSEE